MTPTESIMIPGGHNALGCNEWPADTSDAYTLAYDYKVEIMPGPGGHDASIVIHTLPEPDVSMGLLFGFVFICFLRTLRNISKIG